MRIGDVAAPGVLFHWAAVDADGVRAVDVYDDREAADTLAGHIGPISQELALSQPTVSEYEVHRVLRP